MTSSFFFFNDTATTEIYTLSLHDALPICGRGARRHRRELPLPEADRPRHARRARAGAPAARHGRGRDGDERIRRLPGGPGGDGRPRGAGGAAGRARPDVRACAAGAAAGGGRAHGARHRGAGPRPRRGGVAHTVMNVGVVGNPSYRDLKSLLAHLAQVAPRLGCALYTEERIAAPRPQPRPPPLDPAAPLD